ncbi:M28 family peptidase [Sphingomonas sp. M1-B02]|uniref:M28 family peptidase n=1 Tax=Sphingomonas sp. M1-B02 TaxID=3114300 RepID=UPI00223FB398|nr:M28 family peptidase [Sphingomonas sp. S6-11]UZK64896.1 M20/M25/M40 family metallo-hydrolase [Sphingomonas sp. S6-11]
MTLRGLLLLALLLLGAPAQAQQVPPDQAALRAHIQFLASDAMRGREAGTQDYDVAAEYVAAQMLAIGLKPGGADGGWFQPVKLVHYRSAEKASWTLMRGNAAIPLQFGIDFVNQAAPATPDFTAQGGIVFAGYGLVYPQGRRDDYKGLDVRGKIVALLPGVPAGLPSDVEAHFGNDEQKARLAQARGAKAVILLESAAHRVDFPFDAVVPFFDYEQSSWAGPDGVTHALAPGAPVVGYVSQAGAEKLFAGSRIKWVDVLAAERKGGKLPTGPLVGTLQVAAKTRLRTAESRNVVGLIEGSDPGLARQYVILSAHLDHVGLGDAVNGDRIYNGAMDNAAGVATILEVARALRAGPPPRRSILIIALTAEEKGLIGSSYFAHHATVPKGSIVADLNIDMPILTFPLRDLVILGGERSTLGASFAAAAAGEGLATVPDPAPEEMFFVRSDHYSFVQAGIPSVSVDSGPGGAGDAAQKDYLANHYHKPSDQLSLPFDWEAAAKFARVNVAAAHAIANADDRPRWVKGDFFGVEYDGHGAR